MKVCIYKKKNKKYNHDEVSQIPIKMNSNRLWYLIFVDIKTWYKPQSKMKSLCIGNTV